MLDADLAGLYGVATKTLVRAVRRNMARFPADFMFHLSEEEFENLRYQFGTSSSWGGRRYLPYAFTGGGAGNRTRVRKLSTGTSTCVSRVLFHPTCAHEQARLGLAAQFLAPCVGRAAGGQPDQLRPPVSSGRLILRTAHDCFLGSESKCVIIGTWIFHPGFTRSVGPSDTQHRSRSPRRSRSPPCWGLAGRECWLGRLLS
jgi:ORF6N domain-containing protein